MVSFSINSAAVVVAVALCVSTFAVDAEEESKKGAEANELKALNGGISVMLMGSVGFVMGLFYLVNHPDEDIKRYSWQTISATISIFSAVLLFQGVNGVLKAYVLGESEHVSFFEVQVNFLHFLAWFIGLQFLLAQICSTPNSQRTADQAEAAKAKAHLQCKCWAVLSGHITAFAGINAFAGVQQLVPGNFLCTLCVAPLAWITIHIFSRMTDFVRERAALADDGVKDALEELWDEEAEETEDDVIGLTVSFLIVQVMRFAIGGSLPNPEGEESEKTEQTHTTLQIVSLCAFGSVAVVLEALKMIYLKSKPSRFTCQLRSIASMTFAWSLLFSCIWFASEHFSLLEGMLQQIVVALFVTGSCLIGIFTLDAIADLDCTGPEVDKIVRAIVIAFGILIGFSWEKAFDVAVECTAKNVPTNYVPEHITKLLLAIVLAMVVVPAWRTHILPRCLAYEEEEEHEDELAEETGLSISDLAKHPSLLDTPKGKPKSLDEPLLQGQVADRGLPPMTAPPSGKEEQNFGRIAMLEKRNAHLERSLTEIVQELDDLKKLARDLA